MVTRGSKRDLAPEDFPQVENVDAAETLSNRLMEEWDKEVKRNGSRAKLWKATLRAFGAQYAVAGLAYLFEVFFMLGESITLGYLLDWLQKPDRVQWEGYVWALGLSLCVFCHAFLHHVEFYLGMRAGMQLRVAFIATIYRKCLSLSIAHTSSTGLIVNLVSNDVQRFEDVAPFGHYIWIGPLQVALITYFMWMQIGWASFAAVVVLLLFIPLQAYFAREFGKLRKVTVKWRDERIKSISDMLAGIMVVKLYAWETPFKTQITTFRNTELKYIKKASIFRAINDA
ncbi:ATP-binding cassette sub- C member 8, partial [Borealophlyctis nickersoniae]